jgi:hypothetical protein
MVMLMMSMIRVVLGFICQPMIMVMMMLMMIAPQGEVMSEKEIKREGFRLAEERYSALLPLLSRLDALEEQQQQAEAEGEDAGRAGGPRKGKKDKQRR